MDKWDKSYQICKTGWKQGMPETACGGGARKEKATYLIQWLSDFIKANDIQSIADIGCGDFNWMSEVAFGDAQYIGYDWVFKRDMNSLMMADPRLSFIECNAALWPLFPADLMICRSVMIHLNSEEAKLLLDNMLRSKPKYLLITSYDIPSNYGRNVVNYAPLNIELPPFGIKDPIQRVYSDPENKTNKYLNLYHLNV